MEDDRLSALLDETASDAVLGPSTIDLDRLIAAARHSTLRRRLAIGGTLAVVLAGVGAGIPAARAWLGTPASGTATVAAQPAPAGKASAADRPATPAAGGTDIVDLVQRAIPGSQVDIPAATPGHPLRVTRAAGVYRVDGRVVANITITVESARQPIGIYFITPKNPCTLPPGSPPTREGAPGPASNCRKLILEDGTVAWSWVWKHGQSGVRSWTAPGTKDRQVTNFRPDGTLVTVKVDSQKPTARPAASPSSNWSIPDSALVTIAGSPLIHS